MTGEIDEATLAGIERACLPTIGACAGQFTANTMAMVSEAMGLDDAQRVDGPWRLRRARANYARRAGRLVMRMLRAAADRCRATSSRANALENAAPSSPPPAARPMPRCICRRSRNEAGIAFTIDDVGQVFARTPLIGNLRPGGNYTAKDVYDIGGAAVVIRALVESGHIDGSCLTVTGRTMARRIRRSECAGRRDHSFHERADHAGRRRGGPEGQSLPRRRRHQGGRPQEPGVRRRRARVRGRGRLRSTPCEARNYAAGEVLDHPQRGSGRRVPACARCSASPR